MDPILVIGSVVADVILHIPRLPRPGEDLHITAQRLALGGCAYNACQILGLFRVPSILFAPVGRGMYGDFVQNALAAQGIQSPIPTPEEDNGCCYCLVDAAGERTFLCRHGAEYRFRPEWFRLLQGRRFHSVYFCGLELEEETGGVILHYLEALRKNGPPSLPFYFAPGPRICRIRPEKMARALALAPILHLNRTEALAFTGAADVPSAAGMLWKVTGSPVIVTLGPEGAYCLADGQGRLIPSRPVAAVDTVGAGDSHIGALMAARFRGLPLPEAAAVANRVSAAVVAKAGAGLPPEAFEQLGLHALYASYPAPWKGGTPHGSTLVF